MTLADAMRRRAVLSTPVLCPRCDGNLSIVDDLMLGLENDHRGFSAYLSFANRVTCQGSIRPLQRIGVTRESLGIPSNSIVLAANVTPTTNGAPDVTAMTLAAIAAPQHATTTLPFDSFTIVGLPFESGWGKAELGRFFLTVFWVDLHAFGAATRTLVSALEAFAHNAPADQVLYGQMAVELLAARALVALSDAFEVPKEFVDGIDRSPLSVKLQSVRTICKLKQTGPDINPDILRSLDEARTLRNQVAHGGRLKSVVSKERAGRLLIDTFSCAQYLHDIVERFEKPLPAA